MKMNKYKYRRVPSIIVFVFVILAITVSLLRIRVMDVLGTGYPERVSVASDGTQGILDSSIPSASADGRYIAFSSNASNLVPGDTNNVGDIFVHDRQTGTTERVSVASDGSQANQNSNYTSISADSRYVVFTSYASNLVPGDTNAEDIFVHDRQTHTTERVSVASDGSQAIFGSSNPSISADGRYVAFTNSSSNLVSGDTNSKDDIFVHDRQTGTTERVSVASDGTQGNSWSVDPSISADGRYIAFSSRASNLVPDDTNAGDIFVHDRQTGTTVRVSVASNGSQANGLSTAPSISADGLYIAFGSNASNLVTGDTNGVSDIFVTLNQFVPFSPDINPTINSIANSTINEDTVYLATGSFSDVDSTSWTGIVDYGDGTGEHDFALPDESIDQVNHTFTISHVYKDNQVNDTPYTVTVKITDNQGVTSDPAAAQVTVHNVHPNVSAIIASVNPVQVNMVTTTSATFTDSGILDNPFTIHWQWGDGTSDTYQVSPVDPTTSVALSYSHTYTTVGVYEINLSVTDKDGGVGNAPTFQYLSVYNPTAQGLFSVGQHYSSPSGAYYQNLALTGIARFGLSYKYQGTVPVGNRQFSLDFDAANFHFNATSISSLVIANGMGTLRGTGTLNGSGTYSFLVTGDESANTIRVQIKNSTGSTVYDTQPGTIDTATPITTVTGNVLAH